MAYRHQVGEPTADEPRDRVKVRTPGGGTTETLVDSDTWLWARQFGWQLMTGGYVYRSQRRGKEQKPIKILLHREIMGLKHAPRSAGIVDHINGDPLDNRRENLRIATESLNSLNRRKRLGLTSRYGGVSWFKDKRRPGFGCWRVAVMVNGNRTLIGYFDDEDEAGAAAEAFYDQHMPDPRQGR